jgi:hypothetical protein
MLSHTGEAYQYYTDIYSSPVTMAVIHKTKNNECLQGCGEKDHSYVTGNVERNHAYTFIGNFNKCHSCTVIGNVNKSQSCAVIGKIKECHSYGNQYGSSSKKKKERKNHKRN